MAKILFVEKKLRNEKLGIMCLSGALKRRGHGVELVQTEVEDIDEFMRGFRPDYVAYSVMTGDHGHAVQTNKYLKDRYDFTSVFGGPHCTFFPEIHEEAGVDFVIQGAGEEIIVDIVEGRVAPGVHRGDIMEGADRLPFPDRDLQYKYPGFRDNPIKNIITIRDCPYNCSYCYNHLWKQLYADQKSRLFQRRSVPNVLDEIKAIRARFPLEKLNFIDDNFIQQRSWVYEFCKEYKKNIGLPFLINVRANLVDEELVVTLTNAGLEMVNFALESATPEIQKNVLNRGDFSNEKAAQSIGLFKKYGVRVRMQNMIGLPVEDPLADALATLKFNLEHRVEDAWASIFQPYPKTKLSSYCQEHGYINGNSIDHCAESFFDESRLNIADKDKVYRLQKWWYLIVRYNMPMEFVEMLLDLPLTSDQADHLLKLRFAMSKKHFYGLDRD